MALAAEREQEKSTHRIGRAKAVAVGEACAHFRPAHWKLPRAAPNSCRSSIRPGSAQRSPQGPCSPAYSFCAGAHDRIHLRPDTTLLNKLIVVSLSMLL